MGAGLPARDADGVPDLILIFFFSFRPPSDPSPAVASPSLVAPPAAPLGRPGNGVPDRLGTCEEVPLPVLTFFRVDSFPLESDRFGEPGRFSLLPFFNADVFDLPGGVSLAALASFDSPCFFASSSFSFSFSLSLSWSESDSCVIY